MRIILKNLPKKISKKQILEIFNGYGQITDIHLCTKQNNISKGVCFIGFADEESGLKAIKFRHKSFLNNKKITVEKIITNDHLNDMRNEFKKLTNRKSVIKDDDEFEIKSKSLYITNLPISTEKNDVLSHFNDCNIEEIKFILDETTNKFYGHCIINMKDFKSVKIAFQNKNTFKGCRLKISFFNEQLKQKTFFKQLFFNFDSVVESICREENITRKELLNLKDKNLGMRISLIETHLVEKTKNFLEENGIFLDNLTGRIDKKSLIVRNSNLLSLNFSDCDVKIAPSKCLALLKFKTEKKAKEVYDQLQYKRVKNKAIYVDYLPISFEKEKKIKSTNKIIIKNVPFQADKNELRKLISTQAKIKNLRLPIKRDGMHKGYCFITLETPEDTINVINYFGNNTHLYGRRLIIEPADC